MKIISKITVLVFVLCTQYLLGQSDGNYLPYELPGHTAVKYNTYLMNPAFPIFGKNESQITFFHRNQWMGFKEDKFNTFGLSYGKKWGGDAGKKNGSRRRGIIWRTGLSFSVPLLSLLTQVY